MLSYIYAYKILKSLINAYTGVIKLWENRPDSCQRIVTFCESIPHQSHLHSTQHLAKNNGEVVRHLQLCLGSHQATGVAQSPGTQITLAILSILSQEVTFNNSNEDRLLFFYLSGCLMEKVFILQKIKFHDVNQMNISKDSSQLPSSYIFFYTFTHGYWKSCIGTIQ